MWPFQFWLPMLPCCSFQWSLPWILFIRIHEWAPLTDCKLPEVRSPFTHFVPVHNYQITLYLALSILSPTFSVPFTDLFPPTSYELLQAKCKHTGTFLLLFPALGHWPNSCPFQNHPGFWQNLPGSALLSSLASEPRILNLIPHEVFPQHNSVLGTL